MKKLLKKMWTKIVATLTKSANEMTYEDWLRIEYPATHRETNFKNYIR